MRLRKTMFAGGLLLGMLILLISCSKDKGANPTPALVSMNGTVAFPDTSIIAGLGDDDVAISDDLPEAGLEPARESPPKGF